MLPAVEQQSSARHELKDADQLPAAVDQRPKLHCRIEGAGQMRRQLLQPPPRLLGAVGATRRQAEAEAADAAVARHAAMTDDKHVLDLLRRKDIGIEAGLANDAALDQRAGDDGLVERLVLDGDRPGIPDIVLVEDRRVIRIEPAEDDQVLSARRRVVDQHAADTVEMVGDADDGVRPSRRIRHGTIDVVEQALVVHQRPAPPQQGRCGPPEGSSPARRLARPIVDRRRYNFNTLLTIV